MNKHVYQFEKIVKYDEYVELHLKSNYRKRVVLFKNETFIYGFDDTLDMSEPIKPLKLTADDISHLWKKYRTRALYAESVNDCLCKPYIQVLHGIQNGDVFTIREIDDMDDPSCYPGSIFLGAINVTRGFQMMEFWENIFIDISGESNPVIIMHYLNQKKLLFTTHFDLMNYDDPDDLLDYLNNKKTSYYSDLIRFE